jgi:hypothetical protein
MIPRASHYNPEGLGLDGPDEHPYTPHVLLSELNCSSSHDADKLLNQAPLFWNTALAALQTAAHIALGRVFDQS